MMRIPGDKRQVICTFGIPITTWCSGGPVARIRLGESGGTAPASESPGPVLYGPPGAQAAQRLRLAVHRDSAWQAQPAAPSLRAAHAPGRRRRGRGAGAAEPDGRGDSDGLSARPGRAAREPPGRPRRQAAASYRTVTVTRDSDLHAAGLSRSRSRQ